MLLVILSPNIQFHILSTIPSDEIPLLLLQASVTNTTVILIIILVLLLLTAITAGAETAYFSLTAKDINYLKTREEQSARQAIKLLDQPKILLATILVANNFINIAIVITTNVLVSQFINPHLSPLFSFIIQVIVVTFLLVLFGEVLPKVYATQNNMRMALFSAPVIKIMSSLFSPVSRMLVSSTSYIEDRIGTRTSSLTNEDFENAIELTVGHTATREEVNIFKGILKFGNITVRQIMRTRLDVSGVRFEYTFPQVQKIALDAGYSRMPVYDSNLDHIKGMIHTKDFLPHTEDDSFDWHALIRPAYFVPEGKFIEDLLKEFQQKRIHFAIVVDEFGGTSGIVTLEDVMEEIIGDIKDEFDEDDVQFKKIDENTYVFEGKTLINDVCRVIAETPETFEDVRGDSDSIAGLVLELAGRFPAINETVSFQQFDFTVLELEKMRIKRIKLTVNPETEGLS
ncbi:MAG: gliding motility-associated protein GldE [Bacteroidetes bacterium]|nr:gliding motility-associated protein GldE [Bacteroidota bacterium]